MHATNHRLTLLRVLDHVLFLSFVAALGWLFHYRADYIDRAFGSEVGCSGCFTDDLLIHDGLYLGAVILLFALGLWARRWLLYLPLRLFALAGLLVYAADVMVLEQFYTRLNAADVRMYALQFEVGWGHLRSLGLFAGAAWLVPAAALAWLVLLWVWPPQRRRLRPAGVMLLATPALWMLTGLALPAGSYVHGWAMRNVAAANLSPGVAVLPSASLADRVLKDWTERPVHCEPGQARRPDIVVLILESWSPYQSRLWSGLNDWTPRLDALAREHTMYENFHAAGFTTNEGLISLLAGVEIFSPLRGFFQTAPFETAWGLPATVPRLLTQQGYHSAFLTSGNLAFSSKGEWLHDAGFDYVEGHDHPGYEGLPRRHFESVPDDALYARALAYIDERAQTPQPSFVVIENVSSHQPFVHPYTNERSQEAVFRYMDQTAHDFVQALTRRGHLDDGGLLFIVSDHRAMIPLSRAEEKRFGLSAVSRIPALMIGGGDGPKRVTVPYQQSDLLPTLARLVQREVCLPGPRRDLLDPQGTQAQCLLHARGDNRDHIDVHCPEGEGTIRLHGDDTRFVHAQGLTPTRQAELLDRVHAIRISAQLHHGRVLEQRQAPQ